MDYMKEQDSGAKWTLGVLVEMVRMDKEGAIMETIPPGFKTSPRIQLAMYDFDDNYAVEAIKDRIIAFNEDGSGWVLNNVVNVPIDIAVYEPTLLNT